MRHRVLRPAPPHPAGLVVATLFAVLATTPSLLPRDWLFQGLVSGVSAAAGYGVGVAGAWLLRRSSRWRAWRARVGVGVRDRVPARLRRAGLPLLGVLAAAALVVALAVGAGWQRELTTAMGMPSTTTSGWLRAAPLLVLVAGVLVGVGRGVGLLVRLAAAGLRRLRVPSGVAGLVATLLVATGLVVVVDDVLLARALSAVDAAFRGANQADLPGAPAPVEADRTGGPGSLVAWETLGHWGRAFVDGELPTTTLAAAPRGAVADPVRVYVGIDSAEGPAARADLAVAELERVGGFDREVLLVVTTTGSGWVNAAAVDALELLHGGDTAAVATQYSYLPSWLSFLVDRSRAEVEARALYDAVEARVEAMPADEQPRLLSYGESLGSLGSESVFTSLADIRARSDGAVWSGPPHANAVWHALVERRDPGTPEAEPVYASGLVVRFADDAADIAEPPTPWEEPRVLYLQNRSDPVVWWSPELLLERPDWLAEPPVDGDRPTMTWYPVVTFWQLTFDLVNAKSVPDGHGHNYETVLLDAWAAVAAPEGWTDADTAAAHLVLDPLLAPLLDP